METKVNSNLKPHVPNGGNKFETHRFILSGTTITVVPTGKNMLARVFTVALGVVLFSYGMFSLITNQEFAGLGMAGVGAIAIYAALKINSTDKALILSRDENNAGVHIQDVETIECIRKYIAQPNMSDALVDGFDCYEINLRMQDGHRMTLLNHGNLDAIRRDLDVLDAILEKQIEVNEDDIFLF